MAENSLVKHIGELGGVAVMLYAGYQMSRFQPHEKMPLDKHIAPAVKLSGYALMGYSVYSAFRMISLAKAS